jgi:hypothetical protein
MMDMQVWPDGYAQAAQFSLNGAGQSYEYDGIAWIKPLILNSCRYGDMRPMIASHCINGYRDIHRTILAAVFKELWMK